VQTPDDAQRTAAGRRAIREKQEGTCGFRNIDECDPVLPAPAGHGEVVREGELAELVPADGANRRKGPCQKAPDRPKGFVPVEINPGYVAGDLRLCQFHRNA
jgi:hypothetical protein